MKLFASLYDDAGTPPRQARLPALYTCNFLDPILSRFVGRFKRMDDFDYGVSVCWDETGAQKAGLIKWQTSFADRPEDVIYSGPQFYVGTPIAKTPRPNCKSKGDYDTVDLMSIGAAYTPRTNFRPNITYQEYFQKSPTWNGIALCDMWRIFCRRRINSSNEHSLIPCIAAKKWMHVNGVIDFAFENALFAANVAGSWTALPYDWFVKSTGKGDFRNDTAHLLPVMPDCTLIRSRAVLLNSVSESYAEFWGEAWDPAYLGDSWLSCDAHLSHWQDHFCGNGRWVIDSPLRSQLDRRQAMLELDVIVARLMGLSLQDLLLMYRVSFPILRRYDSDTYYDQEGRCVFSARKGEAYLSSQEWEDIKDMPSGEFQKTITETVFSDTPTERTIIYKAPFFKKDREADYKEAWEMLEKREGKE